MLVYILVDILEAPTNKDAMIKEGVATAKDYEEAVKEIETVLKNAGAFVMVCFFLAVGEC